MAKRVGSPPQVRGKQFRRSKIALRKRITPAGAGKTKNGRQAVQRPQDHPRRCGENTLCGCRRAGMQGSPPQVRGKRIGALAGMEQNRITPAGAGKTNVPAGFLCSVVGSPPQVRGKPRARFLLSSRSGITPAGAGKTTVSRAISHGQRDHPRRCGENKPLHLGLFGQQGSPPQVRGKLAVTV